MALLQDSNSSSLSEKSDSVKRGLLRFFNGDLSGDAVLLLVFLCPKGRSSNLVAKGLTPCWTDRLFFSGLMGPPKSAVASRLDDPWTVLGG